VAKNRASHECSLRGRVVCEASQADRPA
jgi:hypothetical protein